MIKKPKILQGGSCRDLPAVLCRNLSPLSPIIQVTAVCWTGQGILHTYILSALLGLSQGRQLNSFFTLTLLSLLACSWSSVCKRRSSHAWAHLPQGCSLLLAPTGTRAGRTLQPGTRVSVYSHWRGRCLSWSHSLA